MSPEICDLGLGACDLSLKAFRPDHIKPDHTFPKFIATVCTSGMRGNIAYDRKSRHPGENMDLGIGDLELSDRAFLHLGSQTKHVT